MGQYMLVENDIYNMISIFIAPNSTQFGSNNTAQAMEYCQAVQTWASNVILHVVIVLPPVDEVVATR